MLELAGEISGPLALANRSLVLGLDVGGTKCAALVGTHKGEVLDRCEWPSESQRGSGPMIQDLVTHAQNLTERHRHIRVVGVAIGGPLDAKDGIIYSPPNLPGWDGVPLKDRLEQALGLPVRVEHDAAACALAEYHWGAGRGAASLAYLTCGTGLGVGFVFAGKIYRGAGGHPSDIGHIRYRREGPEAYGKCGSLEAFGSGSGLTKLAAWLRPQRWPVPPDGAQIALLAHQGDLDAIEVLQVNAEAVGNTCALIGDMLYPDLILLGSLARYLGSRWLDDVKRAFTAEVYADARRLCRIEPASLGERLQDCSALVVGTQTDLEAAPAPGCE